jgi:phosphoribosylaminoimidazolecarboxamide formyltransferase/IMP cyclohydrolase
VTALDLVPVRRALLSVADKAGLVDLARALAARGVALVSTGGTAAALRAAGVAVEDVAAVTGSPEVLGGRVKTLHPTIHGGILAHDPAELAPLGIAPFDLVVVNLYRFEAAAGKGLDTDALVEEVDIGGPAMTRAAAKNFHRVAVLTDPAQYPAFLEELARTDGAVSRATRERLAVAAFERTAAYDAAIVATLGGRLARDPGLPRRLALGGERVGEALRYGENPHQRGALYRVVGAAPAGLGALRLRSEGKELSYNNLLDVDAAMGLAHALGAAGRPAACVIKHAGPCGASTADDLAAALEAAWDGDPVSAFGSVIGVSRPLDRAAAEALVKKGFVEVVVAPAFDDDAVAVLTGRKGWGQTVRLVEATPPAPGQDALEVRSLAGALLVQDRDRAAPARWEVVTTRAPTAEEEAALRFAWTCVRFVRSNAIAIARGPALVGVGGGQPSRVDAVHLAARKAGDRARGAGLASDAFFPFPDGVEAAAEAGVTAVVQPGGSKKDPDVIARADALGLAMVLTGTRHFRH